MITLFCNCEKVEELWQSITQWFRNKTGINVRFETLVILLVYQKLDSIYWPLNFVILLTKRYIFTCTHQKIPLNIYSLQNEIKRIFSEQKLLFNVNLNETTICQRWASWFIGVKQ